MNAPKDPLTFSEPDFKTWLASHSFAKDGDDLEQKYHSLLAVFPKNEDFWRQFVVPLTNRASNGATGRIHFRDGVDPYLQAICGANYSLFVHFALAQVALSTWDETSLDSVYTRLASAFDVFEGLAIKVHFLLLESLGEKSPLIEDLSRDDFLKLAGDYYDEHYSTLRRFYLSVGKKTPPITIPTKGAILNEVFKNHPRRASYHTITGQIRSFRNAIVHDVRVGMLTIEDGSLMVPKTARVPDYRHWHLVQQAANDPARVAKDFCEVKFQCKTDIDRSIEVINTLYEVILERMVGAFFSPDHSRLRELFGVQFSGSSSMLMSTRSQEASTGRSGSYSVASSKSVDIGSATTNASGVFVPPVK